MDLDRFLNLLAALFGAIGSVYVLKAVANLSPDLIERLSTTYFDFNIDQVETLTSQKADSIVGIVLVLIALVIAIVTIVAVGPGIRMFERLGVAVALAAALSGVAYVTLAFAGAAIQREQKLTVGRLMTARYLNDLFKRVKVQDDDVQSLRFYAIRLLAIPLTDRDSPRAVIERLAKEAGVDVPNALDFSLVESRPK